MEWFLNSDFWHAISSTLIVGDRWLMLLRGLGTTLIITAGAMAIGTVLGISLALMNLQSIVVRTGRIHFLTKRLLNY